MRVTRPARPRKAGSMFCGGAGTETIRSRLRSSYKSGTYYVGKPPPSSSKRAPRTAERTESVDEISDSEGIEDSASERTAVAETSGTDGSADVYIPLVDEVPETCDLEVLGEFTASDVEADSVPIRALSDFSIYSLDSGMLVPMSLLLNMAEPSGIGASGTVVAWIDDDEEQGIVENIDAPYVTLSEILELNIRHIRDESPGSLELDIKIYVQTEHGWYILDVPSPQYMALFSDLWTWNYLFHLLVQSALQDNTITHSEFLQELSELQEDEEDITVVEKMIGRRIEVADFEAKNTRAYIADSLHELFQESQAFRDALEDVPLVQQILCHKSTKSVLSRKRSKSKAFQKAQSRLQGGKKTEKTVVTYRINQFAQDLFIPSFQLVGTLPPAVKRIETSPAPAVTHSSNHTNVHWNGASSAAPGHYESVIIDGIQYNVGDAVIIEPGEDANFNRHLNSESELSDSSNPLANTKWFAKICFFFEEGKQKWFHAQWYQHGSHTLLQETAHPQGLFLINECDDLLLDCIYQKCNLRELEPTDEEPLLGSSTEDNDFFTGLTWDQDESCFMEVTSKEQEAVLRACIPGKLCYSCGLKEIHKEAVKWISLPGGGMTHLGVAYHPHDFVYLKPLDCKHGLYQIAQVLGFYEDEEDVWFADFRILGRHSLLAKAEAELSDEHVMADDRRLYFTSQILHSRTVNLIDGKLYVVHPGSLTSDEYSKWLEHNDHFFVDLICDSIETESLQKLSFLPQRQLKICTECFQPHSASLEEQASLLAQHGPLRGLELFAGAGGLSTGFDATGFVDTKWAVEFAPSAALTYSTNHPDTIVYNQSSNALLKHAVETFEGKNPGPLKSLNEQNPEFLPSMPMPGEVDFIYGGPPCQSFSNMNHHKKQDDARSTLPCNMLSYLEFYHPGHFVLENVKGLVHHKLVKKARTSGGSESLVSMGVVKTILRSLTGLRYQVRFKLLQAGQYGAPQGRHRVIFWGARRDVPLPKFPLPTHLFSPTHQVNLANKDKMDPPTRVTWIPGETEGRNHQCAPFPLVTVMDAISDLPPFDWIDPHVHIKKTAQHSREVTARVESGIAQFDAITDKGFYVGYTEPVAYASKPCSRYQEFMREKMGKKSKVQYHYSRRFSELVVERTVNVPLIPKAYHADLPDALAVDGKYGNSKYNTLFGRIDGDGHFPTIMTTVNPNQKGGTVLHPTQKRTLTIRECARSQGFPDHYKFLSVEKTLNGVIQDQSRQIGNAVPIPLGIALGKELGKALVLMWKRGDQNKEQERQRSPEIEMYDSDTY